MNSVEIYDEDEEGFCCKNQYSLFFFYKHVFVKLSELCFGVYPLCPGDIKYLSILSFIGIPLFGCCLQ